jgi:hypothetical protein
MCETKIIRKQYFAARSEAEASTSTYGTVRAAIALSKAIRNRPPRRERYDVVVPSNWSVEGDDRWAGAGNGERWRHPKRSGRTRAEISGSDAFSRTGDPSVGEFQDVVILRPSGTSICPP